MKVVHTTHKVRRLKTSTEHTPVDSAFERAMPLLETVLCITYKLIAL
jgi:hypothetical protein